MWLFLCLLSVIVIIDAKLAAKFKNLLGDELPGYFLPGSGYYWAWYYSKHDLPEQETENESANDDMDVA